MNLSNILKNIRQSNNIKKLITSTNFKERSFKGHTRICKVIDVYDGDTIKILTNLHDKEECYIYSLRLSNINAPEVRNSKYFEDSELHKNAGLHVRHQLLEYLKEKDFYILADFIDEDKYGRLLGKIYRLNINTKKILYHNRYFYEKENCSVNEHLLNNKLVKPYDGTGEKKFSIQELQNILKTFL